MDKIFLIVFLTVLGMYFINCGIGAINKKGLIIVGRVQQKFTGTTAQVVGMIVMFAGIFCLIYSLVILLVLLTPILGLPH